MTHNVAVDGITEELSADDGDAAGDEERDRPLVEEFEGEVINRNLRVRERDVGDEAGKFVFVEVDRLTPPIPRTASVALLMIPIVAAIVCVLLN